MIFTTPVGSVTVGYKNDTLCCEFGKFPVDAPPSKILANQLSKYFAGEKIALFKAPLPLGPPFTQKCWEACRLIPYGETITYKELAKRAGSPNAMRAAGQAMRNNPLTIITPCHRVIASSGALHGYSGATNPNSTHLRRKKYLIDLEQRTIRT